MTTKKKKVCKFATMLGANTDGIRAQRVDLITKQTEGALKRHIALLEDESTNKRLELDRLLDLAPDTTDSLRPGGPNFKPKEFIERVLQLKKSIKITEEIDLKIAVDTHKELFLNDVEQGE